MSQFASHSPGGFAPVQMQDLVLFGGCENGGYSPERVRHVPVPRLLLVTRLGPSSSDVAVWRTAVGPVCK